jgi:multidrug resistance efflux pump
VEQFTLRPGDIVNPLMRAAGVLIPTGAGQRVLHAGFGQIEAQVMKVGMIAEVTCVSKPWTIIPMVVTDVQDYVADGQFRGGGRLPRCSDFVCNQGPSDVTIPPAAPLTHGASTNLLQSLRLL